MTISCFKDYTLEIGGAVTAPSEYWTLDSLVGGKFVGAIAGSQLTPVGVGLGAGIINGGITMPTTAAMTMAAPVAALVKNTVGQSCSFWVNITNLNVLVAEEETRFDVVWGALGRIGIQYYSVIGGPPYLQSIYSTPAEGVLPAIKHEITIGSWEFAVTTYEKATKTLKFYRNGSLIGSYVTSATNGSNSATGQAEFGGGSGANHGFCDEIGYWGNHVLSAGEVSSLWQGGSASRPSGV